MRNFMITVMALAGLAIGAFFPADLRDAMQLGVLCGIYAAVVIR